MVLKLLLINLIIFLALTALSGYICLGYIYIKRIIHCLKHEGIRIVRFPKWYNY